MNEVKQPKRPLAYYYGLMLLLLMLFNFLFMPWLTKRQIHEVDYNTFVTMVEEGDVGAAEVQTQENLILFTSKDGTTIYQTGMMPDTELTQRLLDAGQVIDLLGVLQITDLVAVDLAHPHLARIHHVTRRGEVAQKESQQRDTDHDRNDHAAPRP